MSRHDRSRWLHPINLAGPLGRQEEERVREPSGISGAKPWTSRDQIPGSPFRPLYDDEIQFNQQPIVLVVAETFEAARYAASLVAVTCEAEPRNTDFEVALAERYMPSSKRDTYVPPKPRGDAAKAYADAPLKVAGHYRLAPEHHDPMEMFGTTVEWHGDGRLAVWDKTQGSRNARAYLAGIFGFSKKNIRVLNPCVGGGSGPRGGSSIARWPAARSLVAW